MQGEWLRKPTSEITVVFVHGIISSGEECWRNANGTYWPQLLSDDSMLEHVGVYIYTYETGVFSGSYSVGDVVDDLNERMELDGLFDSQVLIFVCHSMGGIVVRRLLVKHQMSIVAAKKHIGLFLVASPSLGSQYADWLAPIVGLFANVQADILRFNQNNVWLRDLDKDFTDLKEGGHLSLRGKELVEDKFLVLSKIVSKQVVEPFSGAKSFGNSYKVPDSNHSSIAKPKDNQAIQHRLLSKFIKGFALDLPTDSSNEFTLHLLAEELEALHYSPQCTNVRFTITNLTKKTIKLSTMSLSVISKEPIRLFRLPTPGSPLPEFELEADITEATFINLVSQTRVQFVLNAGESEAFSLTVKASEGFRYNVELECTADALSEKNCTYQSSGLLQLTYPIRTMRGVHHGK